MSVYIEHSLTLMNALFDDECFLQSIKIIWFKLKQETKLKHSNLRGFEVVITQHWFGVEVWIKSSVSKYRHSGEQMSLQFRLQTRYRTCWRRNSAQDQPFFWEFIFMSAGSESESATPEINDPSESGRKAQTWFFRALVCRKDGQTFSNLLDARKQ